jgi:hypothetical protein
MTGAAGGRDAGGFGSGLWSGLVVAFLLASVGMVQIRAKVFGGYPSGDWPRDGYTWHFLPAFAAVTLLWVATARRYGHRAGTSLRTSLERVGRAASPMLGLVVAWSWYGLTGPEFHAAGGCDVYPLCHDTGRALIVIWSAPWMAWGLWNLRRLFRGAES